MNRIRRRIVTGICIVAVILVAVFARPVLQHMQFFRVRQVELVGARYLDESDVTRALGLGPRANIFDDFAAVRRAAAAIPGVVSATVERRLPGTLRVIVTEASPVAVTDLPDRVGLLDASGHVLPFDPTRAPASFPVAVRDSSVARLLARLMRSQPSLYATVDVARIDRGDVVLDVGSRHIRLRPEADDDVFRSVVTVIQYLNTSATAWREIDARYHSRVFVQRGTA